MHVSAFGESVERRRTRSDKLDSFNSLFEFLIPNSFMSTVKLLECLVLFVQEICFPMNIEKAKNKLTREIKLLHKSFVL